MLLDISIRHFMLIDSLNLSLESGLLAITGETGAGKSVLLNALAMAMGARADKKLITPPESEHADITLNFDIRHNKQAQTWLANNGYDSDNECVIRRRFSRDGQSRYTINGQTAALSNGRELAEYLLHIHSQHQQQQLKQASWQGQYLDRAIQKKETLTTVRALASHWQALQKRIDDLAKHQGDHSKELALLQYQLEELRALDLQPNEWQDKHDAHEQLHQEKHVSEHLNEAMLLTADSPSANAQELLQESIRELKKIAKSSDMSKQILNLLDTALINTQEACELMQQYQSTLENPNETLQELESRLSAIHDIARKHQCHANELSAIHQALQKQVNTLLNADEAVKTLKEEQKQIEEQYVEAAKALTQQRKKATKTISSAINATIAALNMAGCTFSITLEPRTHNNPHKEGVETVCFLLQSQPSQPAHRLAKTASGGELSRLSLALMLHACDTDNQLTYIFDEIDVGISGETAKLVGKKLQQLGQQAHVLCVTHLPNVAAQANAQYQVTKTVTAQGASTDIKPLSKKERVEALARMASGNTINKANLDHAKALLSEA